MFFECLVEENWKMPAVIERQLAMAKPLELGREWKTSSGNGRENIQWMEIRLRLQESVVRN
jgi:hypothetical protein